MWTTFTSIFSNTVGKHNKDANDWLGPNSWFGKLFGKGGQVIKDEVSKDVKARATETLVFRVALAFIVWNLYS